MEYAVSFLPESLKLLLELMFVEYDEEIKVASIGQTIMQAVRPRILIAQLQLGLRMQMHHIFGSRFLIDSLSWHGFCCFCSEVHRYETNAAICKGLEIPHLTNDQFVQYIVDSVDHNIRMLDRWNTFHYMGIISTVTPALEKMEVQIPRRSKITAKEITEMCKINIKFWT